MGRTLLLIDFQEGFLKAPTEHLRLLVQDLVVDPVFDEVIATRFINAEGSLWRTTLNWAGLTTAGEQEIAVELPPWAQVVDKTSYGLPQALVRQIKSRSSSSTVVLAGLEVDVCVTVAAAQLFDAGISVVALSDRMGTNKGEQHHQYALLTLGRIIGRNRVFRTRDIPAAS